ncbi:MAG: TraB/GumN family protein [Candidatus Thorarchaeota archaeon]
MLERVVFVPVIHTDKESVDTARRVIRDTKPNVVAVELDRTRFNQLSNPRTTHPNHQPSSSGFEVSNLMNQIALLQQSLGEMTGSSPGEEMLAAVETGREVGAKIALVDRPIELTAQAMGQVPMDEIYRFAEMIPSNAQDLSKEGEMSFFDLLKKEGTIDELLEEFTKEFPTLAHVLIDQRNEYIAKAIKYILGDVTGKIVAVLGAGHIDGVTEKLKELLSESN